MHSETEWIRVKEILCNVLTLCLPLYIVFAFSVWVWACIRVSVRVFECVSFCLCVCVRSDLASVEVCASLCSCLDGFFDAQWTSSFRKTSISSRVQRTKINRTNGEVWINVFEFKRFISCCSLTLFIALALAILINFTVTQSKPQFKNTHQLNASIYL